MKLYRAAIAVVLALVLGLAATPAWAGASDDGFYKGKTVRLVLSTGVGGGYATYGRLLARFMGDYLPGKPNIVVESMPGAGGLRAGNFLYFQAPKDGTTIGIVHSTVPLAPLFGQKGAQFDATKITYLGSLDHSIGMCISWAASPIHTWDDVLHKEFLVGSSGAGSPMEVYPAILNKIFGTHMKVISGYEGGSDIYLAMERGEVQGRCGSMLTAIKVTRPTWIPEHKFVVPIVVAPKRHPDFPDSPTVMELTKDERTRQVFELIFATQEMDRPVLAPPGLPAERVKDLRDAFNGTMHDAGFVEEAAKEKLTIDYVSGEDLEATVKHAYALPPEAIAYAKESMGSLAGAGGD
jgi:tripartite-type tricarboxylate transporter receptor subunit TctC